MLKFVLVLLLCVLQIEAAPRKKGKAKAKTALLTQQERQTAVTTCKEFLANAFKPTLSEEPLNNVFLYKEIIEEEIPVVEEVVVKEPEKPSADEWVILNQIGHALKPQGKVFFDQQYVLCINGHRTLRAGDNFFANYNGMRFTITLVSVEEDKFILKLNNYTLTFNY